MLFKNANLFRVTDKDFKVPDGERFADMIEGRRFSPIDGGRPSTMGWVDPITLEPDGDLVRDVDGRLLICARHDEKVVPSSALNEVVKQKAKRLEELEGRPLRAKELQSVKEDSLHELLPRALAKTTITMAYIEDELVVVNARSESQAEMLLGMIRMSLVTFPFGRITTGQNPAQLFTLWLKTGKPPEHFHLGTACDLMDPEDRSKITCRNQDLYTSEVTRHLDAGKLCTQLQMRYGMDLMFTVTKNAQLIGLKNLSTSEEKDPDEDPVARLDADLIDTSMQIRELLPNLLKAMGGEQSWLM